MINFGVIFIIMQDDKKNKAPTFGEVIVQSALPLTAFLASASVLAYEAFETVSKIDLENLAYQLKLKDIEINKLQTQCEISNDFFAELWAKGGQLGDDAKKTLSNLKFLKLEHDCADYLHQGEQAVREGQHERMLEAIKESFKSSNTVKVAGAIAAFSALACVTIWGKAIYDEMQAKNAPNSEISSKDTYISGKLNYQTSKEIA
jgi:hypothetical protein